MTGFKSLLPGNATAWERANETVSGTRMLAAPVGLIRQERDPTKCDAQFVAPLAWERSVHFWVEGDDLGNRARIASSFGDHVNYGAPARLEAEIGLDTGLTVAIREFFEIPSLVWPQFMVDVVINPGDPTPDVAPAIASALNRKPVRDVLAGARVFARQAATQIGIAAASNFFTRAVIFPAGGAPPQTTVFVAASSRMLPTFTILPLGSA